MIFTAGYESLYNTCKISCVRFSKEIKNALCHKIIYIHIYYKLLLTHRYNCYSRIYERNVKG